VNILVDIIPPKYRKYALYAPFAAAGLALAVMQILGEDVTTALAIYAFVGSALGLTAYANTNAGPVHPDNDILMGG
jgi:hypothetical protein